MEHFQNDDLAYIVDDYYEVDDFDDGQFFSDDEFHTDQNTEHIDSDFEDDIDTVSNRYFSVNLLFLLSLLISVVNCFGYFDFIEHAEDRYLCFGC